VQPNNDTPGDDGNVSPVLAATAIPTSAVQDVLHAISRFTHFDPPTDR